MEAPNTSSSAKFSPEIRHKAKKQVIAVSRVYITFYSLTLCFIFSNDLYKNGLFTFFTLNNIILNKRGNDNFSFYIYIIRREKYYHHLQTRSYVFCALSTKLRNRFQNPVYALKCQ